MDDFVFHKTTEITPRSELPPEVISMLPHAPTEEAWQNPHPITFITKNRQAVTSEISGGNYFLGGIPALMQAVRLLQKDPQAKVTYVCDDQIKKSSQSAHQGHVHPTEWTTPELGTWQLTKTLLASLGVTKPISPDDLDNYSYVHFPLAKLKIPLLLKNMAFKLLHLLSSKNGVSSDDRWQCDAVRESLRLHKSLSDEIVQSGGEPTYLSGWRLIWSQHADGIEKKQKLWLELGITTEAISKEEIRSHTLLRDDLPIYGLKVHGDGKFFPDIEEKISTYLAKKYPNFTARAGVVSELYVDEKEEVFALKENEKTLLVDSFFGSVGHNAVYKEGSDTPLWDEVPVAGVSTIWLCELPMQTVLDRFGSVEALKELPGAANLSNLHVTVWDYRVANDTVYILARATEGANFNSPYADPQDLANMKENIKRFFIGSWTLLSAGSCTRKTTLANVPEYKDNFIHGLSGIGFSFSGAPKEMLFRKPLL